MNRTELFIYRLGLILFSVGIIIGVIAFILLKTDPTHPLIGFFVAFIAMMFVGFGADFIIKRSTEDLEGFIAFILGTATGHIRTTPFKNPDEKTQKK